MNSIIPDSKNASDHTDDGKVTLTALDLTWQDVLSGFQVISGSDHRSAIILSRSNEQGTYLLSAQQGITRLDMGEADQYRKAVMEQREHLNLNPRFAHTCQSLISLIYTETCQLDYAHQDSPAVSPVFYTARCRSGILTHGDQQGNAFEITEEALMQILNRHARGIYLTGSLTHTPGQIP